MNKTVLVTGASKGIGAAVAELFGKNGYRVAINYNDSETAAYEVKNRIEKQGGVSEVFRADVSDKTAVKNMVNAVKARFGWVNVLVANAGISLVKQINDTTEEEWNRLFAVNVTGVYNAVDAVIRDMIDMKNGRIITVSSVWGETGASCEAAYSASKAAVIGYTKAIAKELAPSGITVNCIAPGVIDTGMNARFSADERKAIENEIPAGRYGRPEEVAAAALFFASEGASYVTGEVLGVNGGYR
ncbi:MAG: 3-oxoacyl-ACP reductase FabG [Clostridia bacterium]|nr:3-oxoacyl-ACP reductase FabG [Clostridia bacterium]